MFEYKVVNDRTGEIFSYTVTQVKKFTVDEYNREYPTVTSPAQCKSKEDINAYVKYQRKCNRKIVKIDNLKNEAYHAVGKKFYEGVSPTLTQQQYDTISLLCKKVKVHNVLISKREDLAKDLGVDTKNLNRKLAYTGSHIRVFGLKDGVERGYVKVMVTPHFLFAGSGEDVYQYQEQSMREWYKSSLWGNHQEHIDWLLNTPYTVSDYDSVKFSSSFDKYLKGFNTKLHWQEGDEYQ